MAANTAHSAQKAAAEAFTAVLTAAKVPHAFIGGFAVNMLRVGNNRSTTDIDVEVDTTDILALRSSVVAADPRFALDEQNKLMFLPAGPVEGGKEGAVTVETLPIGEIGLPRVLHVMVLNISPTPILRPGILILTKMKRCAQLLNSTRPRTRAKCGQDLADIAFLLEWLQDNNQKIDFAGYECASKDRLYEATQKLAGYWRDRGDGDRLLLLASVLEHGDFRKIVWDDGMELMDTEAEIYTSSYEK